MKVYVVTQVNEDHEWTGTSVFATRDQAVAMLDEHIDEVNKYTGSKLKHMVWNEGERDWSHQLDGYTYHFEVRKIEEVKHED